MRCIEEGVAAEQVLPQKVVGYILVITEDVAEPRRPVCTRVEAYKHRLTHIARQAGPVGDVVLRAHILHAADKAQSEVSHILEGFHELDVTEAVGHRQRVLGAQGLGGLRLLAHLVTVVLLAVCGRGICLAQQGNLVVKLGKVGRGGGL